LKKQCLELIKNRIAAFNNIFKKYSQYYYIYKTMISFCINNII
jgi:hypothetical protein